MSDTCSCHPGSPSTRHQGTLTSIPFQLYSSPGGIAGVFHLSSDVNGTGLWSVILFRWFVILMCGLLCSSHTDVGRFPRGKYSLGGNCEIRSGYPRSMVTVGNNPYFYINSIVWIQIVSDTNNSICQTHVEMLYVSENMDSVSEGGRKKEITC